MTSIGDIIETREKIFEHLPPGYNLSITHSPRMLHIKSDTSSPLTNKPIIIYALIDQYDGHISITDLGETVSIILKRLATDALPGLIRDELDAKTQDDYARDGHCIYSKVDRFWMLKDRAAGLVRIIHKLLDMANVAHEIERTLIWEENKHVRIE